MCIYIEQGRVVFFFKKKTLLTSYTRDRIDETKSRTPSREDKEEEEEEKKRAERKKFESNLSSSFCKALEKFVRGSMDPIRCNTSSVSTGRSSNVGK